MNEQEVKQIGDMIKSVMDEQLKVLRGELQQDMRGLRGEVQQDMQGLRGEVQQDLQGLRGEVQQDLQGFRDDIVGKFDRAVGTSEENLQHNLDLLVEGQQMLSEKVERLEVSLTQEIQKVDQRVTHVAAELDAHRKDTEAHKGYRVCED